MDKTNAPFPEFSITSPDFDERGIKGDDVFPIYDLSRAWFAVPVNYLGTGDFAIFVDVDCAF